MEIGYFNQYDGQKSNCASYLRVETERGQLTDNGK